jgi:hypothetical protein
MHNLKIPQYISVKSIFKVKFIALMKASFLSDVELEFSEEKFGWVIAPLVLRGNVAERRSLPP